VNAPGKVDNKIRFQKLLDTFSSHIYQQVTLAMDSSHHLAFGILLLHASNYISSPELLTLLGVSRFEGSQGGSKSERETASNSISIPNWVPVEKRELLEKLRSIFDFSILHSRETDWKKWMTRELDGFPGEKANEGEGPVQHVPDLVEVLLSQALIPDCVTKSLQKLISKRLGSIVQLDVVSLIQKESRRPILLLVHPGADPVALLGRLLEKQGDSQEAAGMTVSLGQGQEDVAIDAVKRAISNGSFVLVQNLQASPTWISKCMAFLSNSSDVHANFRVAFTCEVNTIVLPEEIVENMLLVNVQNPPGFAKNLAFNIEAVPSILSSLDVSLSTNGEKSTLKEKDAVSLRHAQVLILVSWLHAVLQERRFYMPQAWQKFYEFGVGDFSSAVRISTYLAQNNQAEKKDVPYDMTYLRGILFLIYGGRLDVPDDIIKLQVLLQLILGDDLLDQSAGAQLSSSQSRLDGKSNRLPGRRLVRGMSLPACTNLRDAAKEIREWLFSSSIRDHSLLYLPPNISLSTDAILLRDSLSIVKRIFAAGISSDFDVTPSAPKETSSARPSSGARSRGQNNPPNPLTLFSGLWKRLIFVKPLEIDPRKVTSPLSHYLIRSYDTFLHEIEDMSLRIANACNGADKEMALAISLSSTPESWMSMIPQPNLQLFVKELEKKIGEIVALSTNCAVLDPSSFLMASPLEVTFSCLPSPAGFFCVLQQIAALEFANIAKNSNKKLNVHDFHLIGSFSLDLLGKVTSDPPIISARRLYLQGGHLEGNSRLFPVSGATEPSICPVSIHLAFIPKENLPPSPLKTDSQSGPDSGSLKATPLEAAKGLFCLPVPIYVDASRESIVTTVEIILEDPKDAVALTLAGITFLVYSN
jgi:hypothetical protein